jgi:hypothetical protein
MVVGYPLSQHSVAPADCRNDAFGIEMRRKAYLFGPFVRYEHFLHECSRRASFMSVSTTFTPSAANSLAAAAPCPLAAPVITETLPCMPLILCRIASDNLFERKFRLI